MHLFRYEVEVLGTAAVLVAGWVIAAVGREVIGAKAEGPKQYYRYSRLLNTAVLIIGTLILVGLWARVLPHTSTFLGLIGAGLAVALREPLLSVAGRLAIFAGRIYQVSERIEINKMSGDVIDVGFFYTRMMEIGNWIGADQYSGRIIQFSNSQIFGAAVFNYTQNFSYIWDEVKLPITYASNMEQATKILRSVAESYGREFLQGAESQLQKMQRIFMVPNFEIEPQVYLKVTDNWLELTLRYLVEPRQRRKASSFIFSEVFRQIQHRDDIHIASSTMDLTVHGAELKTPDQKAA